MLIVHSESLNVYRNLAIEEYLMEEMQSHGPVLLLWRSDEAVVIGKNQNPWKECLVPLIEEEKVALARRISGGGTVYHDKGNLNYCVIVDRTDYQEEKAYELICTALKRFGLEAQKQNKSNLCVGKLKFSGNAFCFRKGKALHHGTLLVHSNLEKLARYLHPSIDNIETRAIDSRPANVCNLSEINQSLTVRNLEKEVERAFTQLYGDESITHLSDQDFTSLKVQEFETRHQTEEWIFNTTPTFTTQHNGLRFKVQKGMIIEAEGIGAEPFLNTPFKASYFS